MGPRARRLLLGVGNLLRSDDAVGVEAVREMAHRHLPSDVEVVDAGTATLLLPGLLAGREKVVVIDALDAGRPAGEVWRLAPEELEPAVAAHLSLHDLHLLHAIEETRLTGRAPREVIFLAVQVQSTAVGIGLSEPVQGAVVRVLALAAEELGLSRDPPRRADGSGGPIGGVGASAEEVVGCP